MDRIDAVSKQELSAVVRSLKQAVLRIAQRKSAEMYAGKLTEMESELRSIRADYANVQERLGNAENFIEEAVRVLRNLENPGGCPIQELRLKAEAAMHEVSGKLPSVKVDVSIRERYVRSMAGEPRR